MNASHRSITDRSSARLMVVLAGVFALTSIAAQGQPPNRTPPPGFQQIGEYQLRVDGELDEGARFYHSQQLATILVRSDRLNAALVLQPRGRTYQAFPPDAVTEQASSTVDVDDSAKAIGSGTFELVNNLPVLTVGSAKVEFVSKPPVVGSHTASTLAEAVPAYAQRSKAHEPTAVYVDKLRQHAEELRIKVFFGSWCSVCTKFMPRILRLEQELDGSKITFEYYGVPYGVQDPEAQRLGVKRLPTGILYVGDEEISRIEGYGWSHPGMAINNAIIRGQNRAGSP